MNASEQRAWLRQWEAAGPALAAEKRAWLARLDDADALRLSEAVLALAGRSPIPEERWGWSGLVAQQALFLRLRR